MQAISFMKKYQTNQSFKYNRTQSPTSNSRMNTQEPNASLSSHPSLLSSSILSDEISIKSELPFSGADDLGALNFALQSFSEVNIENLELRSLSIMEKHHLQLCRSTSFEQILMENHRTALIEAIRQYFENIQHQILPAFNNAKLTQTKSFTSQYPAQNFQHKVQSILLANDLIDQVTSRKIVTRLKCSLQEVKIVSEMHFICPKGIQFQVVYLISLILQQCNDLIEHFKPKVLSRQLKERSDRYADELRNTACLQYLFKGEFASKIQSCFRILVQKWMITLFLMKVGVFENQLKNKSIQDYLKSQVFKNIDLNDLVNQHLIHPFRKANKKV